MVLRPRKMIMELSQEDDVSEEKNNDNQNYNEKKSLSDVESELLSPGIKKGDFLVSLNKKKKLSRSLVLRSLY